MVIRKAKVGDVEGMHKLINYYANKKEMLPRARNELYENIRDFFIVEEKGKIVACCALHVAWGDLAEVKAMAISPRWQRKGLGSTLLDKCFQEAVLLGIKKVFALTFKPQFFLKHGFKQVKRESLPHKIWSECINCPMFPDCNEVPMVKKITKRKG
ncbi:N-acetyltransferase [bacterium]|nr:N-acetyltransferase [bacterium]